MNFSKEIFLTMMKDCFFALLLLLIYFTHAGCSSVVPDYLGITGGKLAPCPAKPNCMSSMDSEGTTNVKPLILSGNREEAFLRIKEVMLQFPGVSLKKEDTDYLWFECSSKLLGFVDDLEFYFPYDNSSIHIRSASRSGYYDLGVNRKRIRKIRAILEQ